MSPCAIIVPRYRSAFRRPWFPRADGQCPSDQHYGPNRVMAVHTEGDPAPLVRHLRSAIARIDAKDEPEYARQSDVAFSWRDDRADAIGPIRGRGPHRASASLLPRPQ